MTEKKLEFLISQSLDGTLPPEQEAELHAWMAEDPESQRAWEQFQVLDRLMHEYPLSIPDIQWDRLAQHLSAAVAAQEQTTPSLPAPAAPTRSPAWWRGGGAGPRRLAAVLAIAASLLFAVTVGLLIHQNLDHPKSAAGTAQIIVRGPQIELADKPSALEIQVGPSPALAKAPMDWRYAEGVVSIRSRVVLGSAVQYPAPSDEGPF